MMMDKISFFLWRTRRGLVDPSPEGQMKERMCRFQTNKYLPLHPFPGDAALFRSSSQSEAEEILERKWKCGLLFCSSTATALPNSSSWRRCSASGRPHGQIFPKDIPAMEAFGAEADDTAQKVLLQDGAGKILVATRKYDKQGIINSSG